jgi:hypothetical protein
MALTEYILKRRKSETPCSKETTKKPHIQLKKSRKKEIPKMRTQTNKIAKK